MAANKLKEKGCSGIAIFQGWWVTDKERDVL